MIKNYFRKALSVLLCAVIILAALPVSSMAATVKSTTAVADNGTAHTFESIMGTALDGNRYAGRVWADKSVYTDGQIAILNTSGNAGSSFKVNLEEGENFQTVFSVLGSSMTTTTTTSTAGPKDIVLVLDTSTSMDDMDSQRVTRLERVIDASNELLANILSSTNNRVAIVTYNRDSETVIPLNYYNNGVKLVVTNYLNNREDDAGVVTAYDYDNNKLGNDSGYTQGTNLQAGIDRGFNILANAENVAGRTPIAIVLTDGEANRANRTSFYSNIEEGDSVSDERLYLGTLLNAAYNKTKVEANYGTEQMVYTVGVDVSTNTTARLLMNPGDTSNKGFNSSNNSTNVSDAYTAYLNWASGRTVTFGNSNNSRWTFDHNYPTLNGAITTSKITSNIYYADEYYDVNNANLKDAFEQIYEQLKSNAFNPITSTEIVDGATGVKNYPLIYVDHIGKYMEVKNIQAVTLFGKSYAVENTNGVYTVEYAKGTNPTTNEQYETSDDIKISILDNTSDGTQKLEIEINQEILPILLEQVESETVGDKTTATINELTYDPLRVYYTVGVKSDVLLPSGEVDLRKIDKTYEGLDFAKGEITLYSNQYGTTTAELDHNGNPAKRDAHVGFKPSAENRYYYHQSNQGIFTSITYKTNNKPVDFPDDHEYGIPWNDKDYNLHWMNYTDYLAAEDDDQVYTYVKYYHPTPDTTDNANAAEEINYLVYTNWEFLKHSVAFYNNTAKKYVNYDATAGYTLDDVGRVMTKAQIAEYVRQNPTAEIYAVLGVGSMRTSRFHNMTFAKDENKTGTDPMRYIPQYTEGMAADHHGNDVVVWLGNNGKLTLPLATGIALTKAVTEPFGNADDTYTLTLKIDSVPAGETANPIVHDANGNEIPALFANNTLKVNVKVDETVYVSGIPGGSQCTVGEELPQNAEYRVESISSTTVTVPTVEEVINGTKDQYTAVTVTNAPKKYGNLYITKELESDHNVPNTILNEEFAFEINGGSALANKEFDALDSKNEIDSVSFDANGKATVYVSARQTIEILNLPENTVVTITENLTTAQKEIFKGVKYRARNRSGETTTEATNNATVTIPSTGSATTVVINTYIPKSTTVDLDIDITKNFADESVKNHLLGGNFNFIVEKYDTTLAAPDWVPIAEDTINYGANEYGKKTLKFENVLENEVYKTEGTYAYQVFEVKGNVANVSYDRNIYTFDVVVTDNNGQLVAEVKDLNNNTIDNTVGDEALDYNVSFNNTYQTAPISMDIKKKVNNLSGDNTVSAYGFKFKSVKTDSNWNELSPDKTNTIVSDAAGEARISGVYTRDDIGYHYYLVSEVNDNKLGWTYSKAQYKITVHVYENQAGKLVADMTIAPHNADAQAESAPTVTENNKGQLYFTNTYDPTDVIVNLNADIHVKKQLDGKNLKAGDFTFGVYENGKTDQEPLLRGTNDANGNISFVAVDSNNPLTKNNVLNFDKVGKYEYDIKEVAPDGGVKDGITYDTTIYDLVIEVENDAATGTLKKTVYFEDSTSNNVTFINYYTVEPTTYKLSGKKVLNGRPMQVDEFEFALYEGDSTTPKETVKNHANGLFEFAEITYTAAGSYVYTITETVPNGAVLDSETNKYTLNGVTYDATKYTITVTVTDNGDGTLTATSNVNNENIIFTNEYNAAPVSVTFKGNKELKGGTLNGGDFAFNLYQTDHNLNINAADTVLVQPKDINSPITNNAGGSFAFETITFTEAGNYFYVIDEDETYNAKEEIVYDSTQHGYRVQVSDPGTGELVATVINMDTGAIETDNANIDVSFVNATFDEVAQKEVAKQEGSSITKIDGNEVAEGEVLSYCIIYYNFTGKDVVVEITDAIPEHTAYIEGTASHNGHYAAGHINWVVNVPRGKFVSVSFSVEVTKSDVIVANTATIRDGINTYTTNTVNNHTYKDPVSKDVVKPEDVSVSVDGEKVNAGDNLIYRINYTNTSYDTVDVTISDVVPENTTYVEGSAISDGVYNNGTIVWNIEDVKPWTTVTVEFMVTVNENIGAKTISNKADVSVANNSYTTNEVSNFTEAEPVVTPEPEITPEVPVTPESPVTPEPPVTPAVPVVPETPEQPKEETPVPESPKTGDTSNFAMLLALAFISGGIALGSLFGKKKKTDK